MCVNVNSKDFKSGFDRVGIGIHNSSKVGEIAFDFVESAGDQSCLVIEVLHGDWFVHGAQCYTGRALGVKHSLGLEPVVDMYSPVVRNLLLIPHGG